jgi:replication factor C subunit 3/5
MVVRVEKYRPVTLDDVVSHQDIISTSKLLAIFDHAYPRPETSDLLVEKFIEKNRLPHLLLYGPPGTGKTSTILAVARRIYGTSYKKQILEVCSHAVTLSMTPDRIDD